MDNKFKIGDCVFCLPGFNNRQSSHIFLSIEESYGGHGYKAGEIFCIKKIISGSIDSAYFCEKAGVGGVFGKALKLATLTEYKEFFQFTKPYHKFGPHLVLNEIQKLFLCNIKVKKEVVKYGT